MPDDALRLTLAESIERLHKEDSYLLRLRSGWRVARRWGGGPKGSDVELRVRMRMRVRGTDTWPEAVSVALGVEVIERDPAEELRQAVREWVEVEREIRAFGYVRWGFDMTSEEAGAYASWQDLQARLEATLANLRRLVGVGS